MNEVIIMSPTTVTLLMAAAAYVLGSIPTGVWLGQHGSGNLGATNTFRILGWKFALGVATFDTFKGYIMAGPVAHLTFQYQAIADLQTYQILLGVMATLGHCYSIFLKFRGGKGVATLVGVILAVSPIAIPVCLIAFLMTLFISGFVSLSSMEAGFGYLVFTLAMRAPTPLICFAAFVFIFLLVTHRENIRRLSKNTEPSFERVKLFERFYRYLRNLNAK